MNQGMTGPSGQPVRCSRSMGISQLNIDDVEVRIARDFTEVEAAQRLRYKVFYEEYQAKPNEEMARVRRDMDSFDEVADHLVVIDRSIADPIDRIVGTYRLLRNDVAARHGRFYTSDEYDIAPLIASGSTLLELGRSCVLAEYRTRPVLQLLWDGIIGYMLEHEIGMMFGCASLHGTDIDALSQRLSYLHHYHLAPEGVRPRALADRYVPMDTHPRESLDSRALFKELPPLIKGYLRVGCTIGEGAVIDHQFNTTDVCIVLPMSEFAPRYRKHYARKFNGRYSRVAAKQQDAGTDGESQGILVAGAEGGN